ncbi:MAG: ABC transporter ATP-binding protein [Culicoidibacterales bacterium]
MIEIINGSKVITTKYLTIDILKQINLTIEKGEMLAITGPSGSGKTSLLNILGGLDMLSKGDYKYDGKNIAGYSAKECAHLRNKEFGFVVQNFALLDDYSVFENVEFPLKFAKKLRKERQKIVQALLGRLEIIGHKNKMPTALSGGQQQKVAIARALVNQPQVIFADEPTGSLDSVNGAKVIEMLEVAHANGATVIIVTHDESLACRCRRRVYLADGKIIKDETRTEV